MKIAILDDYQNASSLFPCMEKLRRAGEVFVFRDTLKQEQKLVDRLREMNVILSIRERTHFSAGLLAKLPHLKFISQTGASAHNIDLACANRLGIRVSITSSHPRGAVELTIGLLLALARNIPAEDRALRAGKWQTTIGTLVEHQTLGILGLGRIGSEVARMAQALGMKVIAWGPTLTAERAKARHVERVTMEEVLAQSDFVSIHLRLSPESRGLIGAEELGRMKKSAFLINTARGAILDEAALIKALEEGRIAGAGLDCFQEEPLPPDSPLLNLENVVLTPHIGYVTRETFHHYFSEAVENILNFLAGRPTNLIQGAAEP